MGNYRFNDNLHEEKQLPAGWRGIGCIMFILLPTVSYVAAVELLKIKTINFFFYGVSPTLFGAPSLPKILWEINAIRPFLNEVYSWTNLEVNILFGLVILLVLSGTIGMLYSVVYRAVNPSRYGSTDAPPSRRKAKKHSR